MAKIKILLASVLKPVDDTRGYEKIGTSLTKINNAQVHIAGFTASNSHFQSDIVLHPVFNFNRLSLKRIFAGWKMWNIILKVKPQLLICNTHELLIVTVLYKILFGHKIIYDVQENYFRNLWYGRQFPFLIRHLLAVYVRVKERLFSPFFDGFLLAEQCYQQEMPYLAKRGILVENKFTRLKEFSLTQQEKATKKPLRLIYTGTIGRSYGTLNAVKLAKKLLDIQDGSFRIIGHCPDRMYLKQLKKAINGDERIELTGGEEQIPHKYIIEKISESNLGIMSYETDKALKNRIPTRIYEYLACRLPFILPANPVWEKIAYPYNASIPVNFNSFMAEEIIETYLKQDFYNQTPGSEIFFDDTEESLNTYIKYILV